jgi:hypothetical protein
MLELLVDTAIQDPDLKEVEVFLQEIKDKDIALLKDLTIVDNTLIL